MSADLHTLGVAAAARALADKTVSSVELAQALLARAEAHAALGAFLHLDRDGALAAAQAADAARAAGPAADRRAAGAQGHLRHGRRAHHRRLQDAGRLPEPSTPPWWRA
jgi:hypothetical protein